MYCSCCFECIAIGRGKIVVILVVKVNQLKIVSHNVFWFQGMPYPDDQPGGVNDDVMSRLVEVYRGLGGDVYCFQEIQRENVYKLLGERLGVLGWYCTGGELVQYGGVMVGGDCECIDDSRSAGVGVQRVWQIGRVDGIMGEVVNVCNVHLPSNRQLGVELSAKQRLKELVGILGRESRPGILAGDFNEMPGGAVCEFMGEKGYVDAAVLTGRAEVDTSVGGGRGDYIWVDKELAGRVVEYGVFDAKGFTGRDMGKEYLSDHLPIWVTLEVGV